MFSTCAGHAGDGPYLCLVNLYLGDVECGKATVCVRHGIRQCISDEELKPLVKRF